MPFRVPTSDDFNHTSWLRRDLTLADDPFHPFCMDIAEGAREFANLSARRDVITNNLIATKVIIANLIRTHYKDENKYITIDRSNDGYKQNDYNPLNISARAIQDVLDFLANRFVGFIDMKGGNYDHAIGRGYATRVRATKYLITSFEEFIMSDGLTKWRESKGITMNTLENDILSVPSLCDVIHLPVIRLRGDSSLNSAFMEFEETPDTIRMRSNLDKINNAIQANYWIDILLSDNEFKNLSRRTRIEDTEFGDFNNDPPDVDLLLRRHLYRVFNNGTFTDGGRFYGGWWQGVPSELRKRIVINWYPTAELDYSNMQIAMLYADAGLPLASDAYSVEGIPSSYRKLIKRTLFKIINATGKIRAPYKSELPEGWTWNRLVEALREKHAPIAAHFNTGVGIKLQKRDADIAENVILTMLDHGHLVLPIHDSFIVEDGYQDLLKEVMREAYKTACGQDILIDADQTWIETLPPLAFQQEDAGVRSLEEWMEDEEQKPEFIGYRDRRKRFLQTKGEEWIRTHHVRF